MYLYVCIYIYIYICIYICICIYTYIHIQCGRVSSQVRVCVQVACRPGNAGVKASCSTRFMKKSEEQVFGFRVQGLGFRFQGSGFRVQGSGFRIQAFFGLYGILLGRVQTRPRASGRVFGQLRVHASCRPGAYLMRLLNLNIYAHNV